MHFACLSGKEALTVTATSEGSYPPWWSRVELVVHGTPGEKAVAVEGGGAERLIRDPLQGTATAVVPGGATDFSVTFRW